MKLKTFIIDAQTRKCGATTVENELDAYYEKLNCNMIELTTRSIDSKYYTIMCDEEGLLKADPIVTATDKYGSPRLVGSLMIFNEDTDTGELSDLTDDDIERIAYEGLEFYFDGDGARPVLVLDW